MKKLFALGLTLALLLGLASVSMASTVFLDIWNGGEVEQNSLAADLSQITVGLDIPMDEFKFACTLSTGKIQDYYNGYYYDDVDTSSFLLKGGYALVNDRQFRLDVTAGFYDRILTYDYYDNDEDSYYSIILGLDAKLKLDRKAWVDFSYAFGINPQGKRTLYEYSDIYDIDSICLLNVKFNYLFTPEFGFSLGYSQEKFDFQDSYQEKFSGVTLGAFLRF